MHIILHIINVSYSMHAPTHTHFHIHVTPILMSLPHSHTHITPTLTSLPHSHHSHTHITHILASLPLMPLPHSHHSHTHTHTHSLILCHSHSHTPTSIPRYEQRLCALYFKKTLDERLSFLRPSMDTITEACRELKSSQRLCRVLEMVLAFGNFMNSGMRGNAVGFRISSLNKITDTKSSSDKDITLLHYLIKMLDSRVRGEGVGGGRGRHDLYIPPSSSLKLWIWSQSCPM